MKRLIGVAIFIVVILLLFNMTEINVVDSSSGNPVSYAKTGYFYSDEGGSAVFLGTNLSRKLLIHRIGYKDQTVDMPFSIFKRTEQVKIEQGNYQDLINQVSQWSDNLIRYKYTFSTNVIQNGTTESIDYTARQIGQNFYFETKSSGANAKTTEVISIGNNMYVSENGGAFSGPLSTTDKQNFVNKNIVFLSLNDIISGSFPSDEPEQINFNSNTIDIVWGTNNVAKIILDQNGGVSEVSFLQDSSGKTFKATLTVDTQNVGKIEVDENR